MNHLHMLALEVLEYAKAPIPHRQLHCHRESLTSRGHHSFGLIHQQKASMLLHSDPMRRLLPDQAQPGGLDQHFFHAIWQRE